MVPDRGAASRWLVGLALLVVACGPVGPQSRAKLSKTPEADRLLAAVTRKNGVGLHDWLVFKLARRAKDSELAAQLAALVATIGPPSRVLEERMHRERWTRWYVGLVVHEHGATSTTMLYRFSLTRRGKVSNLTIREHVPAARLRPPVDRWQPANRFLFPGASDWWVVHGGPTERTNYHHPNREQRHAYDIIVREGEREREPGLDLNLKYYAQGERYRAPAPGVVVFVRNDVRQNRPGKLGEGGGNGVIIDHGFGEYTAWWHAIPGSIRVEKGQRVEALQKLGRVGNSGRSSMPHIHLHLFTKDEKGRDFGLPLPFSDVEIDGRYEALGVPLRGQSIRAARNERTLQIRIPKPGR